MCVSVCNVKQIKQSISDDINRLQALSRRRDRLNLEIYYISRSIDHKRDLLEIKCGGEQDG